MASRSEGVPKYSYADELKGPSDLDISRDGSFSSVANAIAGINYYGDAIGFGSATGFARDRDGPASEQRPLGIRYFLNTGMECSNGQPMHELVDTIPKGSFLGPRLTRELEVMELPLMKGLVPGIVEDAVGATNPLPYMRASVGNVYPKCRRVEERVGSLEPPYVRSRADYRNIWVKPDRIDRNGIPYQTRWVLDRWISQKEWDCEHRRLGLKEGFNGNQNTASPTVKAAILIGLLGIGVVAHMCK